MTMSGQTSRSLGARLLVGFAAFLLAVGLTPRRGEASIVVPLSVEDMTALADEIVHAEVATASTEWYNGKMITRYSLAVHDSFKGDKASGQALELVLPGGEMGKLGAMSPGMPTLDENEEVVLFLQNTLEQARSRGVDLSHVNLDSPLVRSPQIVGGFQGKFTVVRREVEETVGAQRFVREDVRVTRDTPGRALTLQTAPTLQAFGAHLERLNDDTKPVKRSVRRIATVGNVSVPVKDPQAGALRVFDPLPAFAQQEPMTVEEYMARRAAANDKQAVSPEAAAPQTAAGSDPAGDATAK
jgi:hypothetical protein